MTIEPIELTDEECELVAGGHGYLIASGRQEGSDEDSGGVIGSGTR